MSIAVIQTGGKQYLRKRQAHVKIRAGAGSSIEFDALAFRERDPQHVDVGTPHAGAKVKGVVLEYGKAEKSA